MSTYASLFDIICGPVGLELVLDNRKRRFWHLAAPRNSPETSAQKDRFLVTKQGLKANILHSGPLRP